MLDEPKRPPRFPFIVRRHSASGDENRDPLKIGTYNDDDKITAFRTKNAAENARLALPDFDKHEIAREEYNADTMTIVGD